MLRRRISAPMISGRIFKIGFTVGGQSGSKKGKNYLKFCFFCPFCLFCFPQHSKETVVSPPKVNNTFQANPYSFSKTAPDAPVDGEIEPQDQKPKDHL